MSKVVFYIAVLIGIFILIVYYKGTSSVVGSTSSGLVNLINVLQGRDSKGNITNYPQ